MKGPRIILMLFFIFALVLGLGFSTGFAQVCDPGAGGSGGPTVQVQSNIQSNNMMSQSGAQSYGQSVAIVESSPANIPNAPFFPLPVPLIQGGRVGDVTDQLPNFACMKKLRLPYLKENGERKEVDPGETVNPEKIASFDGCFFNRTFLQDLWIDLTKNWAKMVDKGWNPEKMRYRVYYKDRAKGMGINLGGQGGASGFNGSTAVQGSGGGIFGYSSSTADPLYIVMLCEVME